MRSALIALVLAAATILAGWWAVPIVVCFCVMLLAPRAWDGFRAALAAVAAWGAILGWTAATSPLTKLLHQLSSLMHLPSWALIAVTLVFPMGLAWSAWTLGREVRAIGS